MKTLIDKPPAEQKTLIARAQAAIEKYVTNMQLHTFCIEWCGVVV